MIKRIFFIVFCCVVLHAHSLFSCDVCGTSVSNLGIGLLTDYRSNFLRLSYSVSPFTSSSERGYSIRDDFHQMDLSCRYAITNRIRIMAQVPFGYKTRTIEEDRQMEKGFADIAVNATYVLLESQPALWNTNLYLESSLGLSLPIGKYDRDIHDKDLPEAFNIGSGALAYTFQTNAVWSYQTVGLVANAFYQINGKTNAGYKSGNQFSVKLTGFKAWDLWNLQWIPNIGLGVENLAADRYKNSNEVPDTGGKGFFFYSGINIKTDRWLAGFSYALPFAENYAAEGTVVKGRISGQLSFLF